MNFGSLSLPPFVFEDELGGGDQQMHPPTPPFFCFENLGLEWGPRGSDLMGGVFGSPCPDLIIIIRVSPHSCVYVCEDVRMGEIRCL